VKRHAKELQSKSRKCEVQVHRIGWNVLSPSGNTYHVSEDHGTFRCTCKWSAYNDTRLRPCSHVLAVECWCDESHGDRPSFWNTDQDAERQHRRTSQVGVGLLATHRLIEPKGANR